MIAYSVGIPKIGLASAVWDIRTGVLGQVHFEGNGAEWGGVWMKLCCMLEGTGMVRA